MAELLPQLPAFLAQPLECSPNRCRYPNRPLLSQRSSFAIIELFPELWEYALIREEVKRGAEYAKVPVHRADLERTILDLAIRHSVAEFTEIIQGADFISTIKDQVKARCSSMQSEGATKLDEQATFRRALHAFCLHTVGHSVTRSLRPKECLHDLVENSELLSQMKRAIDTADHSVKPLLVNAPAFIERITRGIGEGDDGNWAVPIERALRLCCKAIPEATFEKVQHDMGLQGYRSALKRPGTTTALLSHLLTAGSSTPTPEQILASPQIFQLFQLCNSSIATRHADFAASPSIAPFDHFRRDSYFTGQGFPAVPLVPASAPSSTPSAFDRFARIDNPRHDYPDVLLYVAPRFCPPDKCSGRHPLPENYELVDRYLNAYFAVSFEIRGLLRLKRAGSQLRERLLDLCWRIGNLDFESPSEKKLLHSHVVEVCRHAGDRMPASVKRSLHTLFQWVAEGLKSLVPGSSAVPCLCDLTHLCPALEKLVRAQEARYQRIFKSFPRSPTSTAAIFVEIERRIAAGRLLAPCWQEDWRIKLGNLIAWIDKPVVDFLLANPVIHFTAVDRLRAIVTSSRILEEVNAWYPFSLWDDESVGQPQPCAHFLAFYATGKLSVKSEQADTFLARGMDLPDVLSLYIKASILDPANFLARQNSASIRLRLANDDDQSFQWSQAIYDCTAALYYGPPSFKAFYRRGYALAHLKMWKKAIEDFDQALLL